MEQRSLSGELPAVPWGLSGSTDSSGFRVVHCFVMKPGELVSSGFDLKTDHILEQNWQALDLG